MDRPLEPEIHERVTQVMEQARHAGANIPRRLHEAGLLWSTHRSREARILALETLLLEMKSWMPHEYLRTVNRELTGCTPTEMYHAILTWVQNYVNEARSQAT